MSIQPARKLNRLELVKILAVGVLLEVGILPLLPENTRSSLLGAFEGQRAPLIGSSGFDPSPWIAFLVALAVAYALGRVINIVAMQLWWSDSGIPLSKVPFVTYNPTISNSTTNCFFLPDHRRVFAGELRDPDKVDKRVVEEFKNLVDDMFGEDRAPFADSVVGNETEEEDDETTGEDNEGTTEEDDEMAREETEEDTENDDTTGEGQNDGQGEEDPDKSGPETKDYDDLYAFVKSYNRIHGGGIYSVYLATVFTFTRNLALLALGLFLAYSATGVLYCFGFYSNTTIYTSLASNWRPFLLILPVAFLFVAFFLRIGTMRNMRDFVEYLICDFVSLRTAEEERAASGRRTATGHNRDR